MRANLDRRVVGALAVVALLAIVVYISTPFSFWVADDFNYLTPKGLDRVLGFFDPTVSWRAFYRPLVWSSWALDYAVWGTSPFGWHITSIALNVVTTVVIALIVWRLLGRWGVAILTAALFALHPAHTEAVAWINGRTDEGCGFFYFPAVLFFVIFLQRRAANRPSTLLYVLALVFAVCVLLSKETGVTLPLIFLLTDLVFFTGIVALREARAWRGLLLTHLPFFALAAVYVVLRLGLLATGVVTNVFPGLTISRPQAVLDAQSNNILLLSGLWTGPGLPTEWSNLAKVTVVLAAIAVGVMAVWWLGKVAVYGLLWTAITLIPTYNLVAVRYLYTPSFGICLIVGFALWKFSIQATEGKSRALRTARYAIVALVMFAWGLGALSFNLDWYRAGEEARSVLSQIQASVPDPGKPTTIYFAGAPSTYGKVLLFNTGLPSGMSYVFPGGSVELHEVDVAQPDDVIKDAMSSPPKIKPNPLFLGYLGGKVEKFQTIEAL